MGCWWWSDAMAQSKEKCGKTAKTSRTVALHQSPRAKRTYQLPPNYQPPVADPNRTVFPETFAGKKRQKQLRKRRKKRGRQGCAAARL